jgi:hypothetical protein
MKSNFLKSAVFYGLLFGVLMIIEFLVLYKLDVDGVKNPNLGILISLMNYVAFPVIFIFLAISTFKNKYNEGYVSFSEVLRIGTATTVIAALVYSVFNLIFNYMFPEFVDQTIEKMREIALHQRNSMLSQGAMEDEVASVENIEDQLVKTKEWMGSFYSIPSTIVIYAIIGIITSLILGAFTKKDKPQTV